MVLDLLVSDGPLFQPGQSTEAGKAAQGLLNLSCTCTFYRHALTPYLFHDVLLRTQPKSLTSVLHVSRTSLWKQVKTLTLVVSVVYPGHHDLPQMIHEGLPARPADGWRNIRQAQLFALVSNLPPHLMALNVDLASDCCIDNKVILANRCTRDDYSFLAVLILQAVRRSFLDDRSRFVFRLRSRPASGVICLWKVSDHDGMAVHFVRGGKAFKQDASTLFLNHVLATIPTLEICGNDMCPIVGYGEQHNNRNRIALVDTKPVSFLAKVPTFEPRAHLSELRSLTLSAVAIDRDTTKFIRLQASDIDHLTLLNCAVTSSETWSSFFRSLSEHGRYLRTLRLGFDYHDSPMLKVTCREFADGGPSIEQGCDRTIKLEDEATDSLRSLPYMMPCFPLMCGYKLNARPLRRLSDHEALVELDKLRQARGGQGVVYIWEKDRYPEGSS